MQLYSRAGRSVFPFPGCETSGAGARLAARELIHTAEIAIEPIEGFFNHLVVRSDMPCFKNDVTLVFFRRAEKLEHHILRGVQREQVIVAAVDHQRGNGYPRCEVDLVDFRQFLGKIKTSTEENGYFDAFLDRRKNVPQIGAGAQTVVGKL